MTALAPDVPSPSTFGPDLVNFGAIEDPSTQLDAESWNRAKTQLAMISQTAPIAVASVGISSPTASLLSHGAVWGDSAGVAPLVDYEDVGVYSIQWADEYPDQQGTPETKAVNIREVQVSLETLGVARLATYEISLAYRVKIYVFDAAGAPANVPAFSVSVR